MLNFYVFKEKFTTKKNGRNMCKTGEGGSDDTTTTTTTKIQSNPGPMSNAPRDKITREGLPHSDLAEARITLKHVNYCIG